MTRAAGAETVLEEHDRLERRTDALCLLTESLSLKPVTEAGHWVLAAMLRKHHAALRAHIERQKREYQIL